MARKHFLTFASSNMSRALERIYNQAINLGVYDSYKIWDESYLDESFSNKFKSYLTHSVRGYGYWSWKPQIILQALSEVSEGDLIQYTDAGCHLNWKGKKRLLEYFQICNDSSNGMLVFQAGEPKDTTLEYDNRKLPDLTESKWVKGDLLDYFGCRNNRQVTDTPTIGAGIIFIRKCPESINLIQSWLDTIIEDIKYIDDSPSISPNLDDFIEHRHDQSIFSILSKLNNLRTISSCEYWYPRTDDIDVPDWPALRDYPIHAMRDRGESQLYKMKYNIINRLYRLKQEVVSQVFNRK